MTDKILITELYKILSKTEPLLFFEAGACNCGDTIQYSKIFPNAIIYAYEPIQNNYNVCLNNLEKHKKIVQDKIKLFKLALGEMAENDVIFYNSYGHPKSSLTSYAGSLLSPNPDIFSKWWPNIKFDTSEKVNVVTLKDIMEKENIQKIDFLHLDVQGFELQVLKGAGEYLSKIKLIWLEVSEKEIYKNQKVRNEIENFLTFNGYEHVVTSCHHTQRQEDQLWRLKT